MAEFTGERVVPGEVNPDLWNEHLARYAFASRFAQGRRVVEVGCGAGYGAAQLAATAANVMAIDLSADAVSYAKAHYSAPNLQFLQGSCAAIPVATASAGMVISFELIEHVPDWQEFLAEARRIVAPQGLFIVSTPNKFYYGESRGPSGPNPFHVHEFEFDEFRQELERHFPNCTFFLQNHADAIVFQPLEAGAGGQVRIEHGEAAAAESHFFLAVCALAAGPPPSTFVYVPRSANVLRERELHIHRLEEELAIKDHWLEEAKQEHQKLLSVHQSLVELFRAQTIELEERNRWAEDLDSKLKQAGERVVGLQEELARQQAAALEIAAAYEAKIKQLEDDSARTARWAVETETRLTGELSAMQVVLEEKCQELDAKCQELAACVDLLHAAEATIEERTDWALRVQSELDQARAEIEKTTALLNFVKASRWVQLGRAVGLGPKLGNN